MRLFLFALLFLLLVPAAYVAATSYAHADLTALPPLESGDLIFETALDKHLTLPIMAATGSIYTHVGIVHAAGGHITVINAKRRVIEEGLGDFIRTGWGERFTVLRYPGLTGTQREAIVRDAENYLGRPYNGVFYMKSDSLYCSEVPYLAFQAEHVPIGSLQKIGDLHVNNPAVHTLFEARWRRHPACQAKDMTYEACWKEVMDEPIITPISLAHDPKLRQIYSNYLF